MVIRNPLTTHQSSLVGITDHDVRFVSGPQRAIALLIVSLLTIAPARATDWWNNSSGGSYHSGSNWYYGSVPGYGDDAIFNLYNNGTVSLSQWATPNRTYFGYTNNPSGAFYRSYGTFDMNGNTWATGYLQVGGDDGYNGGNVPGHSGYLDIVDGRLTTTTGVTMLGDSNLTVTNGGQLVGSKAGFLDPAANLRIGASSTAARSLKFEVNGSGSSATFDGGLHTNTTGINYADIIVKNGGTLSLGQTGTIGRAHVQVDGPGSTMSFGSGLSTGHVDFAVNRDSSLTVSNEGVFRTTNGGNINFNSDAFNETTVVLNNGVIDAGSHSAGGPNGAITMGSNSTLSGHGILVGNSNGLTIASPNGAVDYSGNLGIGGRRADIFSNSAATLRGDVSLSSGGRLNSGETLQFDDGSFTVSGGEVNTDGLIVGHFANATMTQSGGTVNVGSQVFVGQQAGSTSTYSLSAGSLSTGVAPGAVDPDLEIGFEGTGTFNQSGGTVTIADELVVGHMSTGDGTVNLSGGTLNISKSSGTGAYIGHRGTGELVVSGTGQLTTSSVIGLGTDAGGTGTITQNGGVITTSSDVYVSSAAGSGGSHYQMNAGTLNANRVLVGHLATATYQQTGGDVNLTSGFHVNNGSTAIIQDGTIDASSGFEIGLTGSSGTLQQSGGTLTGDGQFIVGSAGNGTFDLSGGTVSINSDRILLVGHQDGNGTVNQSGGVVNTGELRLSNANNSVGTYNLSSGRINIANGGVVSVGHFNNAQFNQTGGRVDSLNSTIIVGNTQGADGSHYQVDGGLTETSGLWVGNYGDATFTQTGGYVDTNYVVIAREATSTASYSLEGGRLSSLGTVRFGDGAGSFELDGGILDVNTLNATGGSFTFTSGTLAADQILGMDLAMSDGLLNVGTLNGNLNMSGGVLAPGDSPGITTINGDYLLSGGTLEMEIAGLTQGTQYDFLDINGDWTITGGNLQLLLLSGFMPAGGDSFDLFDFNSVTGSFDSILLPTLTAGLNWDTSSLYTTGIVAVSGTAAVPEPSTFAITGLGLGFVAWRRRRRNSSSSSPSGERNSSTSTT